MRPITTKFKKLFSLSYFFDRLLIFLIEKIEKRSGYFYTLHKRPKQAKNLIPSNEKFSGENSISIVMQGQIILKENFTLETALLYRKYFPSAILILSTWLGEDYSTIEKIKQAGWIVIQNEKPLFNGYHNINYQITTSIAGIQKGKEFGAEYVLKTRTDQRIYNPNTLQLLIELDKLHGPQKNSGQKRRILVPNFGTLKYRPYGIGDMIMFGHIDDMMLYWGAPLDIRSIKIEQPISVIELSKLRVTEIYLSTEYLNKIGHPLLWTLEDSWRAYGKYFCVFDHSLLDMFWYKDFGLHTEFKFHYYGVTSTHELMNYSEWLTCANNTFDARTLQEKILLLDEGANL